MERKEDLKKFLMSKISSVDMQLRDEKDEM